MRKIWLAFTSILLSTILLASVSIQSIVYFSFEINQLEIIQKYCVNKDKPVMKCDGKCYLADQLEKAVDLDDEPFSMPSIEEFNYDLVVDAVQENYNNDGFFETEHNLYPTLSTHEGFSEVDAPPPESV